MEAAPWISATRTVNPLAIYVTHKGAVCTDATWRQLSFAMRIILQTLLQLVFSFFIHCYLETLQHIGHIASLDVYQKAVYFYCCVVNV